MNRPVFAAQSHWRFIAALTVAMATAFLLLDALETQAGATFAALFISLFLFAQPGNPAEERQEES